MTQPLVTFGFVNCNRLHYLNSCFQSVLETTSEYPNKEFIIVDNASVEEGTEEFLEYVECEVSKNFNVVVKRNSHRDPSNEFARGLNFIAKNAQGDFIIPLQGDMQFVSQGWLQHYVDFYQQNIDAIGCITLDAQRTITNNNASRNMSRPVGENVRFVFDWSRPPISGAADVMYSRKIIELIAPWHVRNESHEGGNDSETEMLNKVARIIQENDLSISCAMPIVPASIAIYTDARGTNARVRGNRRYGDYWEPKEGFCYYEILNFNELNEKYKGRIIPVGIEELAKPVGWGRPIDERGNWKKNPIRPETASDDDFVILAPEDEGTQSDTTSSDNDPDYVSEWLDD